MKAKQRNKKKGTPNEVVLAEVIRAMDPHAIE